MINVLVTSSIIATGALLFAIYIHFTLDNNKKTKEG